jgi:hypothetical protein
LEDRGVTSDEQPVQPDETPSDSIIPAASFESAPVPDVITNGAPRIDLHVTGPSTEPPNGMNLNDLLRYAITEVERTRNLERIIWSATGLIAFFVGGICIVLLVSTHFKVEGLVGLATAAVAGISGIWRWIKRFRRDHRE